MRRDRITAHELKANQDHVRIIDVRKAPDDHQIPGSVRHEGSQLEHESVPYGLNEELVLYCGSGNSCNRLAERLRSRGYHAVALEGGYQAWVDAGFETEPR